MNLGTADDQTDWPDVQVPRDSDFGTDVLSRTWDRCLHCSLQLLGAADMRVAELPGLAAEIGNSGMAAGTRVVDCRSREGSIHRRWLVQRHTGYDPVVSRHWASLAPGFQRRAEGRLTALWGRREYCWVRNYDRYCNPRRSSDADVVWDPLLGSHRGGRGWRGEGGVRVDDPRKSRNSRSS